MKACSQRTAVLRGGGNPPITDFYWNTCIKVYYKSCSKIEYGAKLQSEYSNGEIQIPHLWAGGPSIMMLIHKICMAFRGLGNLRNVDIVINEIAAMLLHMGKNFITLRWFQLNAVVLTCSSTFFFFQAEEDSLRYATLFPGSMSGNKRDSGSELTEFEANLRRQFLIGLRAVY